jgi:hypothetical protein
MDMEPPGKWPDAAGKLLAGIERKRARQIKLFPIVRTSPTFSWNSPDSSEK